MPKLIPIQIKSIFGGISPSALVGPEGFYQESYNIDPFLPSTAPASTYVKRGGLIRPGQPYTTFGSAQENLEGIVRHIIVPDTKITTQFIFYITDGVASSKILASNTTFVLQAQDEASVANTLPRNVSTMGRGAAYFNNLLSSTSANRNDDVNGAIYYKNGQQLGRYGPLGRNVVTFRDNWFTSDPPMYDGVSPMFWNKWDGNLYIGNASTTLGIIGLISVSSSESTMSTISGFILPPNFEVNDIDNYGKYLLFAGHQTPSGETTVKTGEAGVFVWDTLSERWDDFIPLPDARCTAIQKVNGVPYVFSGGTHTRISRLHPLESKYTEIELIPRNSPPPHGSTDASGELLVWTPNNNDDALTLAIPDLTASRATVWSLGSTHPLFPKKLHNISRAPIATASIGTSDAIGAIKFIQQIDSDVAPRMVFGFRHSGTLNAFGLARVASAAANAVYRSPLINRGRRFRIKKIHFLLDTAIGAATSTIATVINSNHGATSTTLTEINNTNFSGEREITLVTDVLITTDFFLELTWGGSGTTIVGIIPPITIWVENVNTP